MKKHIFGSAAIFGLLLFTLAPMAAIQGSITLISSDTTSHNDITIDGDIGADWADGYKMYFSDPDDSLLGSNNWGLNELYVAVNQSGISVGLNGTMPQSANGFQIYIDPDSDGEGIQDLYDANTWKADIKFPNELFRPNFFASTWGIMHWVPAADRGWELWNYTAGTLGNSTAVDTALYDSMLGNSSDVSDSTYGPPVKLHHEIWINWTVFYPGLNDTHPVPANAEVKIAAVLQEGDNTKPIDKLPNTVGNDVQNEISNFLTFHVDADGDMKPALETAPKVIWTGLDADDSAAGVGVVGLPLGIQVDIYNGMTGYSNSSYNPSVYYRVFEVGGGVTGESSMTMFHQGGDYNGNNDIYRAFIETATLADGDILEWYVMVPNGTSPVTLSKHNVTLGPMPPIDIDWVGTPLPSGGFVDPDTEFEVTIQIKQLFNGTSSAQGDVWGTELTLRYENHSDLGVWVNVSYEKGVAAGSDNTEFNFKMPAFKEGHNLTYYILIENNNTVATANFTLMSGYAPPESLVFTMADPSGDEYLGYPSASAFNNLTEGLFDLLNFTVTGSAFFTTFHFQLRDSFDPGWGKGFWCHPLFNVYVDTAAGGSTSSVASASVIVDPDHAWEYGFQIAGWIQAIHYADGTLNDAAGISQGYSDAGGEYWWNFTVPTTLTGEAQANWNYTVLVGSNDGNNFRNRKAAAEEWAFGGGHDGDADPRYLDILVPTGGDSAALQEFITNSYDVSTDTQVTVLAVGKDITFVNDTTNPVVSITAPTDGATIDGASVTLTWTVSDPTDATFSGLDYIEVFVDGVLETGITLGDTSAALTLTNGSHIIRINAYDLSGNVGSDEITITTLVEEDTTTTTTSGTPGFEFLSVLALLGVATLYIKRRR